MTTNYISGMHADFFNWRDMSFGPADWVPEGYIPEFECHNPKCRMYQPNTELHGPILAGAPFENQRYSRQLSAWYIPIALSGQQWDASLNLLTFSLDFGVAFSMRVASFGSGNDSVNEVDDARVAPDSSSVCARGAEPLCPAVLLCNAQ